MLLTGNDPEFDWDRGSHYNILAGGGMRGVYIPYLKGIDHDLKGKVHLITYYFDDHNILHINASDNGKDKELTGYAKEWVIRKVLKIYSREEEI